MTIEPSRVMEVLRQHMLVDGYDLVIDLKQSQGNHLVDGRTGDRYLDFFSFFASNPLGFNHPYMLQADVQEKLAHAAIQKPSNSDFYTTELADFVSTLFGTAVSPEVFKYVFLISGGALAVENALKTAFDWKVRKNFVKGYKEERGLQILHFEQAFHGRSGYTLSMTNTADPRKTQFFAKFKWPRVTNPKMTFPLTAENLERVEQEENKSIEQIKAAIQAFPDDIAAMIIEPIQGEGGDNHFRGEFLARLRQICDESDILLIYDEIQSGVGITGKWWAYEHFETAPDIMCFGKKMQVCGILVSPRIDDVDNHVFRESSRINSTWGGNFVDIVRSTCYLRAIEEMNLIANAAQQGEHFISRLNELARDFPELVSNVRGRGLFLAFELATEELRDRIINDMFSRRVIALKSGEKSIRFRPSLTISSEEVDAGLTVVRESIKASV